MTIWIINLLDWIKVIFRKLIKKIEQTCLSLQDEIKSICKDKELMVHMCNEIDYIIYASKLYGVKDVVQELANRYTTS